MASFTPPLERKSRVFDKNNEDSWDYKMCKKIAQLTKVIYTLNCRTEDNEARTKWMQESHQEEIDSLIRQYEAKVSEILEKVKRIDASKEASIRALEENYQRVLEDTRKDLSERADKLTQELENRRSSLNEALKTFQNKIQEKSDNEVTCMRELKDKEIENLVMEYNEKYNMMLVEQLNEKDAAEAELNRSWGERAAKLEEKLKTAEDSFAKKLYDASLALDAQEAKNCTISLTLKALERQINEMENAKEKLESENKNLLQKLEAERNTSLSVHNSETDLRKKLMDTQAELQTATRDLHLAQTSIGDMEKKCKKFESNCAALQNAMSIAETAQKNAKALQEDLDRWERKCSDLEDKISSLSNRANCSQADVENMARKLSMSNEEVSRAKEALHIKEQNHERAMKNLRQDWEKRLISEKEMYVSAESAARLADLESAKKEYEMKLRIENGKLADAHEEALKKLKKQHVEEIEKFDCQLRNAMGQVGSVGEEFLAAKDSLAKIKEELKDQVAAYEKLLRATTEGDQVNADTVSKLQSEIRLLRSNCEVSEKEHQKETKSLKEKMAEEMNALQEQHSTDMIQSRQAFEKNVEQIVQQHHDEIEKLKQEHEQTLKSAALSTNNALSAKEESMMNMQSILRQKLQEEALRYESMERMHNATLDQMKKELERTRLKGDESARRSQEELSQLKESVQRSHKEMEDLKISHEKELEEFSSRFSSESKAEMERLSHMHKKSKEALETQIKQLSEEIKFNSIRFSNEKEELKRNSEKRLEEAKLGFRKNTEAEVKSLQEQFNESIQKTREQFNSERDSMQEECNRNQQLLEREKVQHGLTEAKRREAVDEIALVRNNLEKEKEMFEEMLKGLQQKHKQFTDDLVAAHRAAIARLNSEHKSSLNHLNAEGELKESNHNAFVQQLKNALNELQFKYDFRESRSEDVELINRFMQENSELKKKLESAYNDMKFFKLELINREENYNKLFGRRPVMAAASVSAEFSGKNGSQENKPRTRAALSLPDIGKSISKISSR